MMCHPIAVERMVANATALVNAIASADFPNGFVVISEPLPGRLHGVAFGSGVELAQAHGYGGGVGSVWLDPAKYTDGVEEPTPGVVATYTAHTLHELAHAVVNEEPHATEDPLAAVNRTAHELEFTAERAARWHCHRWVAAYALALRRAFTHRDAMAPEMVVAIVRDVQRYGFELDAVVDAVADFPRVGAWRAMLAEGGEWERRLLERLPPLEQRLVRIADAGTPRPAGERGLA
jgi:hypothetical protein